MNSLAHQTYPNDRFDVIVVDDGSTDGTEELAGEPFVFTLRYFWQTNQGDAAARNFGARQSRADILVFLDDDILLDSGYLAHLVDAHATCENRIVSGTWNLSLTDTTSLSHALQHSLTSGAYHARSIAIHDSEYYSDHMNAIAELPFRDVYSNNMSLKREAYFKIGMMQDLDFPGSNMWCDLDFTYRAYQQGFEFYRSTKAICWHRDHYALNLEDYKIRMRTAAYRAAALFKKYPALIRHLPMFFDKTPIVWDQDSPRLIARKLARLMASTRPILWSMEYIVTAIEKGNPESTILSTLYRYIIGGYIYQGYREGLRVSELAGARV
jgi:glycosyltransferase involved in cell wall biosynthesis